MCILSGDRTRRVSDQIFLSDKDRK